MDYEMLRLGPTLTPPNQIYSQNWYPFSMLKLRLVAEDATDVVFVVMTIFGDTTKSRQSLSTRVFVVTTIFVDTTTSVASDNLCRQESLSSRQSLAPRASPSTLAPRANPSTCRMLTIEWQILGLYRCLWYARGLCRCPCVITPRGFTSLPTQEVEYSFLGFIPTNKQTNKQWYRRVPWKPCNFSQIRLA